jgi:hypothetical protein
VEGILEAFSTSLWPSALGFLAEALFRRRKSEQINGLLTDSKNTSQSTESTVIAVHAASGCVTLSHRGWHSVWII